MIEIEIDGQKLEVEPGSMIIEAADAAGISIPRFCYHKKLSVAANCRMCLIEVEKVGKPLPACATPVTPGMKVFTKSSKALDGQQSVMEFLLINHPLDCPICDQGGACELQDLSMGYGQDFSRYDETKRSVKDENLGSLIATDMTRCIQCTRCVRFEQEIAGVRELGTIGRGDRMEIGTFLKDQALKSEISGNVIDLCPVGALTSRPFRFTARAWELTQHPAVAIHDCVGSNLYIQTLRNKVMRVVPKENEQINETWISDRDRFSYEALYTSDRLTMPLINENNQWHETDWATALNFATKELKQLKDGQLINSLAGLISPNASLEECYLFQKLLRSLGSHNIDHRLHQTDSSDQAQMPLYPSLSIPIEKIQDQELIILVGSHINHEQPMIAHRIRKAFLQGATILTINPYDYEFAFDSLDKKIVSPLMIPDVLNQIANEKLWEKYFKEGSRKLILVGALVLNHPKAALIRYLLQLITDRYQANIGYLTEGSNSAGAWITGCIPHRSAFGEACTPAGYSVQTALQSELNAYMLYGIEPSLDIANPALAMQSLKKAQTVIAFSPYRSASLLECANVILPISPYSEMSGTYVNCEGRWQTNNSITTPLGESRPGWKVLRVLGNLLKLPGFEYIQSDDIRDEIQNQFNKMPARHPNQLHPVKLTDQPSEGLVRMTQWPLYRSDMLVRRAVALQNCAINEKPSIVINAKTAKALGLKNEQLAKASQDKNETVLPIKIDSRIPNECVFIPAGFDETATLAANFGPITISAYHD